MDPVATQPPPGGEAKRPSLRQRLLAYLLIPMLALVVAASAAGYLVALAYSNRVHDRDLTDEVEGLRNALLVAHSSGVLSPQAVSLIEYNPEGRAFFAVRSRRHGLVSASHLAIPDGPQSAVTARPILYDTHVGGEPVRAATIAMQSSVDPADQLSITLAETLVDRHLRADEILLLIVPLQLLLAALLLLLVQRGVRFGLRTLDPLTQRLAVRNDGLAPISAPDVPQEILPLTRTIDGLFGRLGSLMELHERFIADAAHQLRTPLAGLTLHAERALVSDNDQDRDASLVHIRELTTRIARTSSQLLSLLRAQAPSPEPVRMAPVDLADLLPELLSAHVDHATAAGVDLGYEGPGREGLGHDGAARQAMVAVDASALRDLVDNLMANALIYAGRGGTVTVGLGQESPGAPICLSVDDDGPGVPDQFLGQLGDRFFRVPGAVAGGTGLGLAIVQRIANRHHARVRYLRSALGGLRVEIRFPPLGTDA